MQAERGLWQRRRPATSGEPTRELFRTATAETTVEHFWPWNLRSNVRAEATDEAGRPGRWADDRQRPPSGQGGLPRWVASRARG